MVISKSIICLTLRINTLYIAWKEQVDICNENLETMWGKCNTCIRDKCTKYYKENCEEELTARSGCHIQQTL